MKCPYCEYEATEATDERDKGEFWELSNSVELERRSGYIRDQTAVLRGCPACKKVFVDDYKW